MGNSCQTVYGVWRGFECWIYMYITISVSFLSIFHWMGWLNSFGQLWFFCLPILAILLLFSYPRCAKLHCQKRLLIRQLCQYQVNCHDNKYFFLRTWMLYSVGGRGILRLFLTKEWLELPYTAAILRVITYLSDKYFAKCAKKLFRNMNAIECCGYNTLYSILTILVQ